MYKVLYLYSAIIVLLIDTSTRPGCVRHRWAHQLNEQSSITIFFCRPRKTNIHFPFPFSVCSKQKEIAVFRQIRCQCIHIYIYLYIYIYAAISNIKWKPRRFSFIRLPFAHSANASLSFVRLFTRNKQTCPFLESSHFLMLIPAVEEKSFFLPLTGWGMERFIKYSQRQKHEE